MCAGNFRKATGSFYFLAKLCEIVPSRSRLKRIHAALCQVSLKRLTIRRLKILEIILWIFAPIWLLFMGTLLRITDQIKLQSTCRSLIFGTKRIDYYAKTIQMPGREIYLEIMLLPDLISRLAQLINIINIFKSFVSIYLLKKI